MTEQIPEARSPLMTSLAKAVGPLHGRGNLPLYQELQRALRKAIDSRLLGPDDALPPERDLAARSYDAAGDCRTSSGARCRGYGTPGSSEGPRAPLTQTTPSSGENGACEPGYSPCLPRVADLNCSEIPADKKPVRVTGSDPYHLDADHNGIGCQSG